jgi:rfaE bifunctional protein kinase chain/domain
MKVTLPKFERAGVMVVGDVMLDRYWYGPTSRISPEAPVPVVKVDTIEERPGGAANVAMNIASLGAHSRLVGLTGIDDAARALSKTLADVNVKCDFVSVPTHPTITKLRVLSRNQQLIRLDFEEGFEGVDPEPLHERISQALSNIGALVLSDYAKGALASVQQMIQLARKANVPVLIDPKGTDFERYRVGAVSIAVLRNKEVDQLGHAARRHIQLKDFTHVADGETGLFNRLFTYAGFGFVIVQQPGTGFDQQTVGITVDPGRHAELTDKHHGFFITVIEHHRCAVTAIVDFAFMTHDLAVFAGQIVGHVA